MQFNQFSAREPLSEQGKYVAYNYAFDSIPDNQICFNSGSSFQGFSRTGVRGTPLDLVEQEGSNRILPHQFEQKGYLIDDASEVFQQRKQNVWQECDFKINEFTDSLKTDLPTWSLRSDNISTGFNRSVYSDMGRNTQQEMKEYYKQKQSRQ